MNTIKIISIEEIIKGTTKEEVFVVHFGFYSLYQFNKKKGVCCKCILLSLGLKSNISIKEKYLNGKIHFKKKGIILYDNKNNIELNIQKIPHPICGCSKLNVVDFSNITNKINGILYLKNEFHIQLNKKKIFITENYFQNPVTNKLEISYGISKDKDKSEKKSLGEFIERYTLLQEPNKLDENKNLNIENISNDFFFIPKNYKIKSKYKAIVQDIYGKKKLIDPYLVYMNYNGKNSYISSCGSASHTKKNIAIEKAFYELIEKHDLITSWTNNKNTYILNEDLISLTNKNYKKDIEGKYNFKIYTLIHINIKFVFTIEQIAINKKGILPYSFHSSSTSNNINNAINSSLDELIGFIGIFNKRTFEKKLYPNIKENNFKYLYPENKKYILNRLNKIKNISNNNFNQNLDIKFIIKCLYEEKIKFYFKFYNEQNISFKGYYIVRCISPELVPIIFGKETQLINKKLNLEINISIHPYI